VPSSPPVPLRPPTASSRRRGPRRARSALALALLLLVPALSTAGVPSAQAASASAAAAVDSTTSSSAAGASLLVLPGFHPGERICGLYGSSKGEGLIGTGLAVMVRKGDTGDTGACDRRIAEMTDRYDQAFPGSYGETQYPMWKCEDAGDAMNTVPRGQRGHVNPCDGMVEGPIYKIYTPNDLVHPQPGVGVVPL
jgi:hypothetical protein